MTVTEDDVAKNVSANRFQVQTAKTIDVQDNESLLSGGEKCSEKITVVPSKGGSKKFRKKSNLKSQLSARAELGHTCSFALESQSDELPNKLENISEKDDNSEQHPLMGKRNEKSTTPIKRERMDTLDRCDEDDFIESDSNRHQVTFVQGTQYLKSLRHYLTRDALPTETHYRNNFSITDASNARNYSRPTLEELQEHTENHNELNRVKSGGNQVQQMDSDYTSKKGGVNGVGGNSDSKGDLSLDTEASKVKRVKFGWIEGVFMRCLLNIWGVMLFLRLSWVVGQCGIVQGILVITLCNVVTLITTISMSAVCTNGQIRGGGIYYMISRSLGPEFGGAIGITFTVANSIAVATYLIGFCTSLMDMIREYKSDFSGVISSFVSSDVYEHDPTNDIRLVGALTLVLIFGLAIVGMEWVTRVQIGLLALLMLSQLDFIIGSFIPGENEKKYGFVGYNSTLFVENLLQTNFHSNYDESMEPGFFDVFGVFFPAVTGIVAGANLSGDLKNPASAIPKGTFLAIGLTYVSYFIYGIIIGATYLPQASGVQSEYEAYIAQNSSLTWFNSCENRTCWYGSSNDQQTMTRISYTGFLVYAGCFAATLSSAIASLVGAPRVLQALARDKLYPLIGSFGMGTGSNDDPIRGYVLVFIVALGCTMIGNLDYVSNLLSNFFVAAYALINFSVFHATISKSPGWRPSFRYYNHWVSLFGTILCISVMFLMDIITAFITFFLISVLYLYINYRKPEVNWGSSTQAQQFLTTLKNIQQLNEVAEHVKTYRPKVLVLCGMPGHRPPLVEFASLITKNVSLLICGAVDLKLQDSVDKANGRSIESKRLEMSSWLRIHDIKSFSTVTLPVKSFSDGAKSVISLSGLGKMAPNTVLLGFKTNYHEDHVSAGEYTDVLNHVFDMNMSVAILRFKCGLDYSSIIGSEEQVAKIKKRRVDTAMGGLNGLGAVARRSIAQFNIIGDKITQSASSSSNNDSGLTGTSRSDDSDETDPSEDGVEDGAVDDCKQDEEEEKREMVDKRRMSLVAGLAVAAAARNNNKSTTIRYVGKDGKQLPAPLVNEITYFSSKHNSGVSTSSSGSGFMDVWWLYDDGGLTLLLPFILTTRSRYSKCKMRVFALANRKHELDIETRNMAALLSKFRIQFCDITVIPDVNQKARDETRNAFKEMLNNFDKPIEQGELDSQRLKTNRHLRLSELLQEHSNEAELVVMTLPVLRRGAVSAQLYLAWLDIMTRDMPPFLLVRGNQQSVLTFYS